MRIALITNARDTCGIAIYGENLMKYLPDDVEINLIPPSSWEFAVDGIADADVVHINYHEGLRFGFDPGRVASHVKALGKPLILTNHTTSYVADWYSYLDRIVTHIPEPKFGNRNVVVPQPILELDFAGLEPTKLLTVTQAGFPFAWKNYNKICAAMNQLYGQGHVPSFYFFMPDTYHGNAKMEVARCRTILYPAIMGAVEIDWLPDEEIIRTMYQHCSVACYYTEEKREGPSASVRMGIAAQLPTVVNGNAYQYQDILEEEGIYPCYRDDDLAATILKAYQEGKRPTALIKKQSFAKVGRMYKELYQECLNSQ